MLKTTHIYILTGYFSQQIKYTSNKITHIYALTGFNNNFKDLNKLCFLFFLKQKK